MSANDLAITGMVFLEKLEDFNNLVRITFETDVEQSHDKVSPMWQDDMRREYDTIWQPLKEQMEDYIRIIGPSHVETIRPRMEALLEYLNNKF